jgi:DNA-directed RNA polymerase subunit RPC12/RpoP
MTKSNTEPKHPIRCYNCGYEWQTRRIAPPARCPACQSRKWYIPTHPPLFAAPAPPPPHPLDILRNEAATEGETE